MISGIDIGYCSRMIQRNLGTAVEPAPNAQSLDEVGGDLQENRRRLVVIKSKQGIEGSIKTSKNNSGG